MVRKTDKKLVGRRDLFRGAAVAGAGMAAAGILGGATPAWAQAPVPEKWDEETDVVIVGAGGTGLTAAIEILEAGGTAIILEKSGVTGGTTALSGGIIQASETPLQAEMGFEYDTHEDHYQYYIQAGEGLVDPELVRVLVDNSADNIAWLEAHGIKYVSLSGVNHIPYVDPNLMKALRIHAPQTSEEVRRGGAVHANALTASAEALGADIRFETPATALIRDPEKGVVGVKASSRAGEIHLRARKAVILATSSYDRNEEMARSFSPQQLWAIQKGGQATAVTSTGDGIKMAMAVGADLAGMGGTIGYAQPGIGAAVPGIWVNKHGQRFVNEDGHYAYKSRAVYQQEGSLAWAIFDDKVREQAATVLGSTTDLEDEIAAGRVTRGNTLRALANQLGINAAQLQATVELWNTDADNGEDNLFGKTVGLQAIDEGPFYATPVFEYNLGSCGGVKINTSAQVIDVFGEVIPRLYAGGMVAGGFIGPYYPGSGTAVASTVCFGRIAAQNALAEEAWE